MSKTVQEFVDSTDFANFTNGDYFIGCTSLPGDPLHSGHLDCLEEGMRLTERRSWEAGDKIPVVVVIVNGDDFLTRKKGFYLIPQEERRRVIESVKGVDYALIWESPTGSQRVHEAIRLLRPNLFWKGGDVVEEHFPAEERDACRDVGAELVFGVGGGKGNSSSNMVGDFLERVRNQETGGCTPSITIGGKTYYIE